MKRDDVTVKAVDQLNGVLTLVENEELVSNIVSITPSDPERKFQVSNCVKFDTGSCTTHIFFFMKISQISFIPLQKSYYFHFEIISLNSLWKLNVFKSWKTQYEIYDA